MFARTDKPIPAEKTELLLPHDKLDALVGTYELMPGFTLAVAREGDRLTAQPAGQEKAAICAESETEFFLKEVDARLVFELGADGRAIALSMTQGPMSMKGARIG